MQRHRYQSAAWLLLLVFTPLNSFGADAYPVFTDPNADGLAFGNTDVFAFGQYGIDVDGPFVVYNQNFSNGGGDGAGLSVPLSNGENGIDVSFDGGENQDQNDDVVNTEPANSVFSTIGNSSGRLENGNVLRYSVWVHSDPTNPIEVDPQIQPVVKFEFWKEALSTFADTNGGQIQPTFGDKVFDIEQHGGALGIPVVDQAEWIDFDGDGNVLDASAAGQGRVTSVSTEAWTLVEVTHTVNDFDWIGISDDIYTVTDIEEIRGVIFMGDFTSTDLTGDGDGGNLIIDNVLFEVFSDAASVTANLNPEPPALGGLAGDFNGDNTVDAADYTVWRDGLGTEFTNADYDTWVANYGNSAASTAVSVPEPTSLLLIVAGIGLCCGCRNNC